VRGQFGTRSPLRRAARHDGFFVIDLDLDEVRRIADAGP